jgi:hypothetical protein
MRNNVKYRHVKPDYLMRLAMERCRVDTVIGCSARFIARAALQRASSVFSSAKSEAIVSRARTCTGCPRSTITSAGRGREL